MSEYTFSTLSIGDYKEKGSRFHAIAEYASSIEYIKSKLIRLKEQYPDASHICYAYRIKTVQRLDEFFSDAREPQGSAGLPILNVLKKQDLINSIIFVIRYFGGIKLGIPKLIYSYRLVAEEAIRNAELIPYLEKKQLLVTYPYKLEGVIKSIIRKYKVELTHEDFDENIATQLEIDIESVDKFIDSIMKFSSSGVQLKLDKWDVS